MNFNIVFIMSIKVFFGKKVRYYRNIKKISQEELASLSGLHRTYIGCIERAERNITIVNAEKIAQALDKPLSVFFMESEI